MVRAVLAAWIVLLVHQGEEIVIALPAVMLVAAFFLMRYAAGGKSDDEQSDEEDVELPCPPPTFASTAERTTEAPSAARAE